MNTSKETKAFQVSLAQFDTESVLPSIKTSPLAKDETLEIIDQLEAIEGTRNKKSISLLRFLAQKGNGETISIGLSEILKLKNAEGRRLISRADARENKIELPSKIKVISSEPRKTAGGQVVYPLAAYTLTKDMNDMTAADWQALYKVGPTPGHNFEPVQDYKVAIVVD